MKKRDLLFAGLLLCSVSAFAQPQRYPDDAKQIFLQDFEGDAKWQKIQLNEDPKRPTTLYTWQEDAVDMIEEVAYYKRQDSKDKDTVAADGSTLSGQDIYNGSRDWEIAGYRDTLLLLYNGVMRTDAVQPDDSILNYDTHSIMNHTAASQSGTGIGGKEYGLDRYGEDGGKKYFSYTSANGTGVGSYSNGNVPEYRRNLFIRLNPGDIEENASYRLTVFAKATQLGATAPQMAVQLMRGFFHSEKNFIVNWADKKEFYYSTTKTSSGDFVRSDQYDAFDEGKWEKITLMAYYIGDSLSAAYPYNNGYWWPNDWTWVTTANKDTTVSEDGDTTMVFRYIKQPDKFFARLSFRSDSTRFDVDNLSLTKSWIAGVEHYNDMIRVDFGYKTNLGDLAEQARKINKIATVEVPGDYFEVWACFDGEWEEMPILTAEYQGDGYMYMWTKPLEDGSVNSFEGADEVLVTFRNPIDREDLFLKYTGDRFPMGEDSAWLANGKVVPDFHNEISALNPTIVTSPVTGKSVKSLKNLPPVMQYEPYEEGAFGLDPAMREMKFKFSRNLAFDNKGESTDLTQVTLKNGSTVEYWDIVEYPADDVSGWTTIKRPAKYTTDLKGDYVLSFKQVTHLSKVDASDAEAFGDDVVFNYHFGKFDTNPVVKEIAKSDWKNEDYTEALASGQRYYPESIYVHSGQDKFTKGTGGKSAGKCGLYLVGDNDCQIYFSNRGKGNTGNIYTIENLAEGNYSISFRAILWGGSGDYPRTCDLYVYAKPDGEIENGNDKGFAVLEAATKTLIGQFAPKKYATSAGWPDGTETFEFTFAIPANGDYVIEWVDGKNNANSSGSYRGFAIGDYTIRTAGDLSFVPVRDVNAAIARANEKLAALADAKYKGVAFDALKAINTEVSGYIAKTVAANKGNLPSEYAKQVKAVDDAIAVMNARVDTVDLFTKAIDAAATALQDETYKATKAYADLLALEAELMAVEIPAKTNAELAEYVAAVNLAKANLEGIPLLTKRVVALDALATKLGSDIASDATVKAEFAALSTDDDQLADVYKAAIALAIYEKIADPIVDSLDVTPFIKNYFLYQTPKVTERTDKNMPDNQNAGADPNGAQIQHTQHKWNSGDLNGKMPIWVMITQVDYTDLYPGWTARAFNEGNAMVTGDKSYEAYKQGKPIFDAEIGMDWNGKAELSTEVTGLPTGLYTLGVDLPEFTSDGGEKIAILTGTTTEKAYENKATSSGAQKLLTDSITVNDGKLGVKLMLRSQNGWSRADNFQLAFRPLKEGVDYTALATAQKAALSELITVVDASAIKAENVEFFTLGGMKINAPKAGDILIRKTTKSNGKIVVDKVLLK